MEIGMMQVNGSFSGQSYMPYSVVMLQASATRYSKCKAELKFRLPIFKREPISKIIEKLDGVAVLAISLYVWNEQISLETARRLKTNSENPPIVIVGGPQVPDNSEEFLAENPFIDFCIHGEGEAIFPQILDCISNADWKGLKGLPSISFIDKDIGYKRNDFRKREKSLETFDSPYLSGAFDALIAAFPNEQWTALWETNRGCPFQCTFCDWGSATAAKVNKFSMDRLRAEIDWFVANKIKFIYCCDANFGILARDKEIAEYIAFSKAKYGYPEIFSVQSTKNSTKKSFETQKIISDAGLSKGVSLSMQSLDPEVLRFIKRDNIHQETYDQLQMAFTSEKIDTYTDIVIGLPGETFESFRDGVQYLIEKKQYNRIRFNNLSVLPNAEVGNPDYQAQHGLVISRTKVVHVYGEQDEIDDCVDEFQSLVVGTKSAQGEEWVKIRAFAYMIDFLFYDKTLQIPMLLMQRLFGVKVKDIAQFALFESDSFPIFKSISDFFLSKARAIQSGDVEYCYSKKFLNSYWKPDEMALLNLVSDGRLYSFFDEAEGLISKASEVNIDADMHAHETEAIISDALALTKALFKTVGVPPVPEVNLRFNVYDWFNQTKTGENTALIAEPSRIIVSPERTFEMGEWARFVVWYGNRTGAYFYDGDEVSVGPS